MGASAKTFQVNHPGSFGFPLTGPGWFWNRTDEPPNAHGRNGDEQGYLFRCSAIRAAKRAIGPGARLVAS